MVASSNEHEAEDSALTAKAKANGYKDFQYIRFVETKEKKSWESSVFKLKLLCRISAREFKVPPAADSR